MSSLPQSDRCPTLKTERRRRAVELIHRLLTEGDTPLSDAFSVATGIFIGCLPLYGLHLLLSVVAARLLGLNRLKTWLASNLSVPVIVPFLLFVEIQVGSWLRRAEFYGVSWDAFREISPWEFPVDLMLGSLLVGAVLGGAGFLVTLALRPPGRTETPRRQLTEGAARRYLDVGIRAWWRVRRKLRGDRLMVSMVTNGILPGRGRLVDIGCESGAFLALLVAYREFAAKTALPSDWKAPPQQFQLHGIEARSDDAGVARKVLAGEATIVTSDLEDAEIPACESVVLLDALHRLSPEAQMDLLVRVRAALSRKGLLVVRETHAGASWRFAVNRFSQRALAVIGRDQRRICHFQAVRDWERLLTTAGFSVHRATGSLRASSRQVLLVTRRSEGLR
jgi:uncharacterized protein (DUF2062 family)